ncbi:hypothetical protein LCI18_003173 [Fusarium solani-melongenae]|uniref:Uncharacterized protein n=1 Tax=Fusarium solani subsp. cucurbitae TaxID=2747967 RepID=A0ACD3YWK1_FUSSC|nr:hypothetical protein LCI18_003173 [Fusarium solani-melongenae]
MVYEHSICNFAATGAVVSGKGLYSSVEWRAQDGNVNKFDIECSWNPIEVSSSQSHCLIRGPGPFNLWKPVDQSEINKRGWVLQERLLSPRTVHFAAEALYWECRESYSMAFVSSHGLYDLELYAMSKFHNQKAWVERTRQAISRFMAGRGSLSEAYGIWDEIRRAYTSSALTYPSDKLVALSSVAAMLERFLSDKYLASIWGRTAVYDLLWHVREPRRRSSHGAPSWSWASMNDGPILWSDRILPRYPHDAHQLATVIRAETTAHNPHNPTGRVSSGRIELQCFALVFDAAVGGFSEEFLREIHENEGSGFAPAGLPPIDTVIDEGVNQVTDEQLFCLLLVLENRMVADHRFMLHGLIVAQQTDHFYRRIGYFRCWWESECVSDLYWYLDRVGPASGNSRANFYGLVTLI